MNLILVGMISGIITGLGMGGGSILILVLVSFMSFSQHVAQAANLIFFIPTAITAILIHIKNKNVDKETGKNYFRKNKNGKHKYVIKAKPDSYYQNAINEIIK